MKSGVIQFIINFVLQPLDQVGCQKRFHGICGKYLLLSASQQPGRVFTGNLICKQVHDAGLSRRFCHRLYVARSTTMTQVSRLIINRVYPMGNLVVMMSAPKARMLVQQTRLNHAERTENILGMAQHRGVREAGAATETPWWSISHQTVDLAHGFAFFIRSSPGASPPVLPLSDKEVTVNRYTFKKPAR